METLITIKQQKGTIMKRRILPIVFTALAAVPIAGAWTSAPASAASAKSAKSQTFKGSTVSTRWGPLQVSIVVKSKKITSVKVSASSDTARSQVIDSQAVPTLKQETLQAQSANINEVSGATDISAAYIKSLQAAIKSAQQHKALK
jgi:uncharacterized protein with FMN-binding domain